MNDPLAYLLTWHTYGTWLQGDHRGSVDRDHREYEREFARANQSLHHFHKERMNANAFILNESQRLSVQKALAAVREHRKWTLNALHVRTNHVHAVVTASQPPERVLNDFKSYATRALRQEDLVTSSDCIWARHGSTRYLWTEDAVYAAIDYVINRQGAELVPGPVVLSELETQQRPLPNGRGSDCLH